MTLAAKLAAQLKTLDIHAVAVTEGNANEDGSIQLAKNIFIQVPVSGGAPNVVAIVGGRPVFFHATRNIKTLAQNLCDAGLALV